MDDIQKEILEYQKKIVATLEGTEELHNNFDKRVEEIITRSLKNVDFVNMVEEVVEKKVQIIFREDATEKRFYEKVIKIVREEIKNIKLSVLTAIVLGIGHIVLWLFTKD